jgi:hypothetical protein
MFRDNVPITSPELLQLVPSLLFQLEHSHNATAAIGYEVTLDHETLQADLWISCF